MNDIKRVLIYLISILLVSLLSVEFFNFIYFELPKEYVNIFFLLFFFLIFVLCLYVIATSYFSNATLIVFLALAIMNILPSLTEYLRVIDRLIVVFPEIFLYFLMLLFVLNKYKFIVLDKGLIIFIILWVMANFLSMFFAEDLVLSMPLYLLAFVAVPSFILAINTYLSKDQFGFKKISKGIVFGYWMFVAILCVIILSKFNSILNSYILATGRTYPINYYGYLTPGNASFLVVLWTPFVMTFYKLNNNKLMILISFLICLLIVAADRSRGVMIVGFFYLITYTVMRVFDTNKSIISFFKFFGVWVFFIFLIIQFDPIKNVLLYRFCDVEKDICSFSEIIKEITKSSRFPLIDLSIQSIKINPFGVGYGSGLLYVEKYDEFWNPHNIILAQTLSAGLMSIVAIIYIFGLTVYKAIRHKSNLSNEQKGFVNSLLLSLCGFFIYGSLTGGEFIASTELSSLKFMTFILHIILIRYLLKVPIQD